MNKQHIKYWFVLAIVALFIGCEDKYEAPTDEPSHTYLTTSFGNLVPVLQVNGQMAFLDLSQGVVSREWTFPEGAVDVIDSENDLTADGTNVKVRFVQFGEFKVKCVQEFSNNVWVGEQKSDSKVYETEFTITVLDSVRSSFSAVRTADASALVANSETPNEVVAGREVTFSHDCTGAPTTFRWLVSRQDGYLKEYNEENPTVKFSGLGTYDVSLIASSDFGADTLTIENYITVVPSTEPLDLLSIGSPVEDQLAVVFSRDMENPATCNPEAFTLSVTNGGTTIPVTITGFTLDDIEKNIVIIKLSERIYNTDDILLSYNADLGNLITTDKMEATSFADYKIQLKVNMLESLGFDEGIENSTSANFKYAPWGAPWDGYDKNVLSTAMPRTGNQSLYINMNAEGGAIFVHRDADGNPYTIPVEEGKVYEVGFWIYMEELGNKATGDGLIPDFRFLANNWGSACEFFFDAEFPTGKWVYQSVEWNPNFTGDLFFFMRGYNVSSTVPTKFYLDDFKVYELDKRP